MIFKIFNRWYSTGTLEIVSDWNRVLRTPCINSILWEVQGGLRRGAREARVVMGMKGNRAAGYQGVWKYSVFTEG